MLFYFKKRTYNRAEAFGLGWIVTRPVEGDILFTRCCLWLKGPTVTNSIRIHPP